MNSESEYRKEYYKVNKEKEREQNKKYYSQHKDEIKTNKKKWYEEHLDEQRQKARERYRKNKETNNLRAKQYNQEHKEEIKAKRQERHRKNPNKRKDSKLRHCYGITIEIYNNLLEQQNGVCAICGCVDINKPLAVDHNHTTKEIRGLLCGKCNKAIGLFYDSISLLESAINYLSKEKRDSLVK